MARKRKDKIRINRLVLAAGGGAFVLAVFGVGLWAGMQFGAETLGEAPSENVAPTRQMAALPAPAPVGPKPRDQAALDRLIAKVAEPVPEEVAKPAPAVIPPIVDLMPAKTPAWIRNAVAYRAEGGKPMIALVIDDVGIDRKRSDAVVALPAPLTLSFLTYGHDLDRQTAAARARGHELMVHVPMQPKSADADPGPKVLRVRDTPVQLAEKLEWGLGRFNGYVGVNNHMGSRFTTDQTGMQAVMAALGSRGLFFLDSVTAPDSAGVSTARAAGVPVLTRDVFLDNEDTPEEVRYRLEQVEKIALRTGTAIAIGHPHDATITVLRDWIPDAVSRGFAIVPVSALVRKRYPALWEQAGRS
ncbi:divergent polysaccharide deacetylase family protein [Nisaea nitritireducens]|uniref:divergent polysaccharide deacetylase family protein n=1 Tax=Nisaea nitritireducens TaxID=568392 RepID=UPI0018668CD5|nr:divergent polysaccharide deacetylase family protein [Nisaea nitritireducens]